MAPKRPLSSWPNCRLRPVVYPHASPRPAPLCPRTAYEATSSWRRYTTRTTARSGDASRSTRPSTHGSAPLGRISEARQKRWTNEERRFVHVWDEARKWLSFPVHFQRHFTRVYRTTGPHFVVRKRVQCQNYCNALKLITYLHNSSHRLDESLLDGNLYNLHLQRMFLLW